MSATCLMCGASMGGFTELEALQHQSACLDASLSALTPPRETSASAEIETVEPGKPLIAPVEIPDFDHMSQSEVKIMLKNWGFKSMPVAKARTVVEQTWRYVN